MDRFTALVLTSAYWLNIIWARAKLSQCPLLRGSSVQGPGQAQELKCVIVVTINCELDIPLHIGLL